MNTCRARPSRLEAARIVALVPARTLGRAGQSGSPARRFPTRGSIAAAVVGLVTVILSGCASSSGHTAAAISTTTLPAVPVVIRVDGTTKLKDGQGVKVHVTAKSGSQVFGFEARLCAGAESFRFDSDMRPTKTGKCISKPVSTGSEEYQEVRAAAPFEVADSVFHVGVGNDQFAKQDGTPVTITCGPGHPCQLVLKVQFPNGFAIRAFPLTYA